MLASETVLLVDTLLVDSCAEGYPVFPVWHPSRTQPQAPDAGEHACAPVHACRLRSTSMKNQAEHCQTSVLTGLLDAAGGCYAVCHERVSGG